MLVIKPQLQHKGGEDISSFVTMWPGTLTYFKMENRMPGMNTTWAPKGPWKGHWPQHIHHVVYQTHWHTSVSPSYFSAPSTPEKESTFQSIGESQMHLHQTCWQWWKFIKNHEILQITRLPSFCPCRCQTQSCLPRQGYSFSTMFP